MEIELYVDNVYWKTVKSPFHQPEPTLHIQAVVTEPGLVKIYLRRSKG